MKKNATTDQLNLFCDIITHILEIKSPHTACHIHNVPILAQMISEAVHKERKGSLKNIKFTAEDFYKIKVAAQLHDTGKTTTPDYLLEKSTKLEFLRNRIHEIRNRFEIMRRDAEIIYLKKIIESPKTQKNAEKEYKQTIKELEQDFEFIARCNIGDTTVKENDIKRLKNISKKKYKCYFNRLLGLSWHEQQLPSETLKKLSRPRYETLLQDSIEDSYKDIPTGEVYNLSTEKGTINPEERKKIEQHVSETREILKFLQLPEEYQCIINYAAEHHERVNGDGYPLGLKDKDLSIPSKILMLADVFEALTSTDRPYKAPKKISEALRILQTMKNKQMLDSEIYEIFIKQQIFMQYAKKYLKPEQIDIIDINDYI